MKRLFIVIGAVLLLAAVIVSGTFAFITHKDTTRNVVTTGNLDFEICEATADGSVFPAEGVQILPGETVSKVVTVKNISDHPLYLRVKLIKGVNDDKLSAEDCISMNIDDKAWLIGDDGYYYFHAVLNPDEETSPIFTEVYVNGPAVDNRYLGKYFTLNVTGEAVQSENNGTSVFDALGWPDSGENQ